jgi:hypothetical protein
MSAEASTSRNITSYTISDEAMAQLLHQNQSSGGGAKVKDPEPYYGDRAKLRGFISQCELKFRVEKTRYPDDDTKIHFAYSLCRGNAWAWAEPSLKRGESTYKTWEDFRAAITKAFGEADSREIARRKLKDLKQGSRSASAYWADFQRIIADLDYNDSMYIDQFQDGLHLDVQRQLALIDEKPTTMIEFANKAIALDNRLYNFRTLRTRNEPQFWEHQAPRHQQQAPQHEQRLPDPDPMELDATRRFPYRNQAEMNRRRKNGQCFNCGKMGHYSSQCPNKKPGPFRSNQFRRPFRASEVTYEDEHERRQYGDELEEAGKDQPQE